MPPPDTFIYFWSGSVDDFSYDTVRYSTEAVTLQIAVYFSLACSGRLVPKSGP